MAWKIVPKLVVLWLNEKKAMEAPKAIVLIMTRLPVTVIL